jgi:hypothetical protein
LKLQLFYSKYPIFGRVRKSPHNFSDPFYFFFLGRVKKTPMDHFSKASKVSVTQCFVILHMVNFRIIFVLWAYCVCVACRCEHRFLTLAGCIFLHGVRNFIQCVVSHRPLRLSRRPLRLSRRPLRLSRRPLRLSRRPLRLSRQPLRLSRL